LQLEEGIQPEPIEVVITEPQVDEAVEETSPIPS
jgi:hypothetical protein